MRLFFVLVSIIFSFNTDVGAQSAEPVSIALYWESLCPYSRAFIADQLIPAYSQLRDIMSVHFVPFGNAAYYADGDTWWFTCQHGVEECDGNKMLSCALNYYNDTDLRVPFIGCVEASDEPQNAGENCSMEIGLDWERIGSCYYSEESNTYLHQFGLETQALVPALSYVPWIVVDGVHTDHLNTAAQEHLFDLVCGLYQGDKPSACTDSARQ